MNRRSNPPGADVQDYRPPTEAGPTFSGLALDPLPEESVFTNDFVVPIGDARLAWIESRASATVLPRMGEPLERLARAVSRYEVESSVIYHRPAGGEISTALLPGVRARGVADLPSLLRIVKKRARHR